MKEKVIRKVLGSKIMYRIDSELMFWHMLICHYDEFKHCTEALGMEEAIYVIYNKYYFQKWYTFMSKLYK